MIYTNHDKVNKMTILCVKITINVCNIKTVFQSIIQRGRGLQKIKKNFINKNCKTTKTKFINSLITNFIYNSRNI